MMDKVFGSYATDQNSMISTLAKIHTNNTVLKRRAAQLLKKHEDKKTTTPVIKTESSKSNPIPNHNKK